MKDFTEIQSDRIIYRNDYFFIIKDAEPFPIKNIYPYTIDIFKKELEI